MAQHSNSHVASSQKALMLEMKSLQEEPVEGFKITLVDEADLYNWEVAIFGPPNTLYEGGYFKARIKFPVDYPYSPPAFRFLTKMWHPNIYELLRDLDRLPEVTMLSPLQNEALRRTFKLCSIVPM
uniref:UBC core domain-containing protein n=1 Tax=Electrophorus electricus TaxID=8005 RepID=A0A4W4ETY0_ELEEL